MHYEMKWTDGAPASGRDSRFVLAQDHLAACAGQFAPRLAAVLAIVVNVRKGRSLTVNSYSLCTTDINGWFSILTRTVISY
jgi:hypothetical protein